MLSAATPPLNARPLLDCAATSAFPNTEQPVNEVVPGALAGWESYYVIVGSSAAALT